MDKCGFSIMLGYKSECEVCGHEVVD